MCDHGCGMEVTVENEMPVAVKGSGKHPFNKGWLCAKGRSALDLFRSPSRLKTPMIRKGSEFEEATREDTLAHASEKMHWLRETYGPQSFAIYYGEGVGHQEIYPALLKELGFDPSPIMVEFSQDPEPSEEYAFVLTTGGDLLCYTHGNFATFRN